MKKGGSFGWQTSLADLALILFMLSAASLHNRPADRQTPAEPARTSHKAAREAAGQAEASPQSEPLAVYDATPGAPRLSEWLDQQAADPRQQLTITARYGPQPGAREKALAEAARLMTEAGNAGRSARIVVEPGAGAARVALAYDTPNGVGAGTGAQAGPNAQ